MQMIKLPIWNFLGDESPTVQVKIDKDIRQIYQNKQEYLISENEVTN